MSINSINSVQIQSTYSDYGKDAGIKESSKKTGNGAAKTDESKSDVTKSDVTKTNADGVVYEKADETKKATYSVSKMSAEDRASLVEQLKADQKSRQESLLNIVKEMMNGQGKAYSVATGDDALWRFLAKGDFTVDAATKAQAVEDISEDGYWGVTKTSQRLFDFALALAGDDVDKMKEMQTAMEKGFKQATGSWGRELPEICKDTLEAANKLFEDYYASKTEE